MASSRVGWFAQARDLIRARPALTDDEVAELLGIPRYEIPHVIVPARREVDNQRNAVPLVRSTGQWRAEEPGARADLS